MWPIVGFLKRKYMCSFYIVSFINLSLFPTSKKAVWVTSVIYFQNMVQLFLFLKYTLSSFFVSFWINSLYQLGLFWLYTCLFVF